MNKQKGHEGDVERLIEEHQPQLKAFIHRRVSSKEDAEDILQDVFYQLVKAVSNTLNPIEQVTSWLYRVTRNTIINKGKKKSEEEWPVSAYAPGLPPLRPKPKLPKRIRIRTSKPNACHRLSAGRPKITGISQFHNNMTIAPIPAATTSQRITNTNGFLKKENLPPHLP